MIDQKLYVWSLHLFSFLLRKEKRKSWKSLVYSVIDYSSMAKSLNQDQMIEH